MSTLCLNTGLGDVSVSLLKILVYCLLSESLPQFDFEKFPHHAMEMNTPMILNDPTPRNPVDLNQVSMEAR
jgi:hypothetical protein